MRATRLALYCRIAAVVPRDHNKESQGLNDGLQYRLGIADEHPLFCGAVRVAVVGVWPRVDRAEAGTFDELVELLERGGEVDLVLLDLTMPGARGFSG